MNRTPLILASFAADSLALAAHWVYDTAIIDKAFGRINTLRQPLAKTYHQNKNVGDFTHYGDQTLILLESIAGHDGFNIDNFFADWQRHMTSYGGYCDKATSQTLANLSKKQPPLGCGSSSSDLGGAARIAPLVFLYHDRQEALLESVHQQTMMTHNNSAVLAGAEVLAKTCFKVLHGSSPTEAVRSVVAEGINDLDLDMRIRLGLQTIGKNSREAIHSLGQGCTIGSALPGVIHLITTYENDLQTALIENVMAGGDSAARGLCVGMVLGAYLGKEAIPEEWLSTMTAFTSIQALLNTISTV